MKKKALLSEAIWVFEPDGLEMGPAVLVPAATNDTLVIDEGEPLPLLVGAGDVTGLTVGAAKPVASIAQLADYLVNGFWQYNGTIAHRFASNTITYNINALNSAEQFLAVSAMQAWHDVANINFVQTSGAANLTFSNSGSMQAYTSAAWYSSGAIAYANIVISSDWITNDGGAYDGKTGIDSYGYQTYIHEIGHALGLGHQGPYNGSASYSTNAIYANDTWQYSIMSYFSENNYSGSSYRYVVTPQMADIYAMGSMYGAASATRTGDTVYGFNSNAGAVFNFGNYTSAPALTIYDSGGSDTLDCSGYSNAQLIDLRAGAFSSVGGLVNNIGIALSATIEKAIGGAGNDTLIANNASCTLSGGAGNDIIMGGAGDDTVLYSGTKSNYTISYNAGTLTFAITDKRAGFPDGSDTVSGVESFQFADGTIASSALVGLPNLSVQVFPGSSSVAAGAVVSVSTFVVNFGQGPAASSISKVYLSADPNITTSDLVVATISSGSLAGVGQFGYYDARNLSLTLPANLASGTYYIGAIADFNNQIAESNEADNTYNVAAIAVTGSASPPNLSAQVFSNSSSATAGAAVSVSAFVINFGNSPAAGSTSKIYLSVDPNITTSDLVLATINSGSLAGVGQAGYYDNQKLSLTLPANLATGTYYIGAIADSNNQIAESNEADNTYNVAAIAVTGSASPPNLSAQVFSNSSSATAGAAVSVSAFVVNFGNSLAAGSTSKIYLSVDPDITTSDLVLATINSGSLAGVGQAGYYDNQKLSLTLPANLATGTYYIGAIADSNNQIIESDETDNTYNVAQITVTGLSTQNLQPETLLGTASMLADTTATLGPSLADQGIPPTASVSEKVNFFGDSCVTKINFTHLAQADSSSSQTGSITEVSLVAELNAFFDSNAMHSAFRFSPGSRQDLCELPQRDVHDEFAQSTVNVDFRLANHAHFEISDGLPIHNATWEIAQHQLGDFFIR